MTNKQLLEDLLSEFDELGMEPTTIVPNPQERAIRWKRELISAIEQRGAEVAREIFWEIDKLLARIITDDEAGTQFIGVDMQKYYALKKKYTEANHDPA